MLKFVKKWGIVCVLGLALAIIIIDTTVLNVAIGPIIKDLHTDIQSVQWIITTYALVLAGLTITGGRLGDLFGRKKMFLLGAIIFALGSFTASRAHSVSTLMIGWSIIEGIGAALMMPATASLLISNYRGRDRAIAFGIWGGIAGASSAFGPLLGGYLTTTYSWRAAFLINVVVVGVLLIGSIIIKEVRDKKEKPTLDIVGVMLSSTGLFALVFGIIESSTYGWYKAKSAFELAGKNYELGGLSVTPIAIAVGLTLLVLFYFWERKVESNNKTPLVSPRIFKNKQFSSGTLTLASISLGLTGLIFALPIFFQGVKGQDAFHTGLSLLPLSLSLFVAAPFSALLLKKFTAKRIIQSGLLINLIGVVILRSAINVSSGTADLALGLALFGVGMGFVMAQINNLTLSAVSTQQAGEAAGVNNTIRQIGASLGSAIIGAVLLSALSVNILNGINASKVIPEKFKSRIGDTVSEHSSNIEFGERIQIDPFLQLVQPKLVSEIKSIADQATTDAVKTSLTYSIMFGAISLIISIWLPNVKNLEKDESLASGH